METKTTRHSKSLLLASFSSFTSERGSWQRKTSESKDGTDSAPEKTTSRRPYNHGLPPTVRLEGPLLKELKKHKKAGKGVAGPRGIIRRTSSKVKHLTHALLYHPSSFSSSFNIRQNLLLEDGHHASAYDSNSSLESTIAVATASQNKNDKTKEEEQEATIPPSPRATNRVHFDERPPALIPTRTMTQPPESSLSDTSASSLSSSHNSKKKKKTKHKKQSRRSSASSKCSKKMSQSNQAQVNQDDSFDSSSSYYDPWYGPEDYVRFRKASKQTVMYLDQEEDDTWKDPTSRVNLLLALHQCTTSSAATNMTVEEQPDNFSGHHSYFLTETQLARFDGLYDGDQDEIEDEECTSKLGDYRNTSSFSLLGMEGDMQIQLEQDKHQRRVNQYHLVHEIQTIAAAHDTPADRLASVVATACARLSAPAGRLALFYGQSLEKSLLTVNGATES